MLAEVIDFIRPASCPMAYAPKDSPTSAFRSMRKAGSVQNKRAPRYCDAPLLRLSGSPTNLRRPAVIRQAIRSGYIAMRVPAGARENVRKFRVLQSNTVDFDHDTVSAITESSAGVSNERIG